MWIVSPKERTTCSLLGLSVDTLSLSQRTASFTLSDWNINSNKITLKRSRIMFMCMYGPVLPSLLMHAARYHTLYWKFAPATKNLCRLRSLTLDSYWMVLFCCPFRAQTDPYVSMLRLQKLHSCSPVQPMDLGRSIDMKEQMIFPPQKRSFLIFLTS